MADTTKIYENIFIKKNAAGDREYIKVPYAILADPPTIPSAVTSINGLVGGTLTSPITLTGGDSTTASKMILDANGQITDTGTATLFGRSSGNLIVGSGSYPITFRGKQTRPTYNGNDMALKSDIPDISGKANLSGGNEFVDGGNTFKGIGGTTQISGSNVWLQAVGAQGSASLVVETGNKNEVFKVEADSDNGIIYINRAISIEGDTGTSGQVLTSQGSGNAPAWTTLPTFSLSGTTLTITL